jgi:hypothetical protein
MQTYCYEPGYCHCRGFADGCNNCGHKWYKGHPCTLPRAASERHEEQPLCSYCVGADKRGPRSCCVQIPSQHAPHAQPFSAAVAAAPSSSVAMGSAPAVSYLQHAPPAQIFSAAVAAAPSSSVAMGSAPAVSYPQHAFPAQIFSAAVSAAPSSSVAMSPAPLCDQPSLCHCKGGQWGCKACGHKRWRNKACTSARAKLEKDETYPLCYTCVDEGGVGGPRPCCKLPGAPGLMSIADHVGTLPVHDGPPAWMQPILEPTEQSIHDANPAWMQPTPASSSYDRPPAECQLLLDSMVDGQCPGCQELRKVIKDLVVLNNLAMNTDIEQHLHFDLSEIETVSGLSKSDS